LEIQINFSASFPLLSGYVSFPHKSLPSRTSKRYNTEETIRESLSYYFPDVEFMGIVGMPEEGSQYNFIFSPLSIPYAEREHLQQLLLNDMPQDMRDLVLKHVSLDKLNNLFFFSSVPFPASLKQIVLSKYQLRDNAVKVTKLFPDREINWYEVLDYMESPTSSYYKYEMDRLISTWDFDDYLVIMDFSKALLRNNVSAAMLIYADSRYQAVLKKLRETDPNTNWAIYTMILDVLLKIPEHQNINYVETYKFALRLPDFDISTAVGLDYVDRKSLKLRIGSVITRLSARQLELESKPNLDRLKKGMSDALETLRQQQKTYGEIYWEEAQ
jgi:hypothetical protein